MGDRIMEAYVDVGFRERFDTSRLGNALENALRPVERRAKITPEFDLKGIQNFRAEIAKLHDYILSARNTGGLAGLMGMAGNQYQLEMARQTPEAAQSKALAAAELQRHQLMMAATREAIKEAAAKQKSLDLERQRASALSKIRDLEANDSAIRASRERLAILEREQIEARAFFAAQDSADQRTVRAARAKAELIAAQNAQFRANLGSARGPGGPGGMSSGMSSMMLMQASFGIQDFLTVMAAGGSFQQSMVAASNNLGFLLTMLGGAKGAIAGVGVTIAALALPKIIELTDSEARAAAKTEEFAKSLQRLTFRLADMAREREAAMNFTKLAIALEKNPGLKELDESIQKRKDEREEAAADRKKTAEELKELQNIQAKAAVVEVPKPHLGEEPNRKGPVKGYEFARKFAVDAFKSMVNAQVETVTNLFGAPQSFFDINAYKKIQPAPINALDEEKRKQLNSDIEDKKKRIADLDAKDLEIQREISAVEQARRENLEGFGQDVDAAIGREKRREKEENKEDREFFAKREAGFHIAGLFTGTETNNVMRRHMQAQEQFNRRNKEIEDLEIRDQLDEKSAANLRRRNQDQLTKEQEDINRDQKRAERHLIGGLMGGTEAGQKANILNRLQDRIDQINETFQDKGDDAKRKKAIELARAGAMNEISNLGPKTSFSGIADLSKMIQQGIEGGQGLQYQKLSADALKDIDNGISSGPGNIKDNIQRIADNGLVGRAG